MTDERNFLDEARAILAGTSAMLPEKRHLQALADDHDWALVELAAKIEKLKEDVLNRE